VGVFSTNLPFKNAIILMLYIFFKNRKFY